MNPVGIDRQDDTGANPRSSSLSTQSRLTERALLIGWVTFLGLAALRSLELRPYHDAPLMQYVAWLIRRGYVPYTDIFDMNMPGTYLVYVLGQVVFGEGDLAFRVFDLVWLIFTDGVLVWALWPLGRRVAIVSTLLLSTVYFQGAPWESMQRDWLMVAFLVGAVGAAARAWDRPRDASRCVRLFVAGLFAGISATFKPQSLLLVLPLGVVALGRDFPADGKKSAGPDLLLKSTASLVVGTSLPLLLTLLYLWRTGALPAFWWGWSEYLAPLYSRLDGLGIERPAGWVGLKESLAVTLSMLSSPRKSVILLLGTWGLVRWVPRAGRLQRAVMIGLMVLGLYGIVHEWSAGKHWSYHWWPYFAGMVPLAVMGLLGLPDRRAEDTHDDEKEERTRRDMLTTLARGALPTYGILVLSIFCFDRQALEAPVRATLAQVDDLASELRERSQPGDRVQVFDTTGGGIQAAYLARMEPGSRFVYDFHFFHHPQSKAIQALRGELFSALEQRKPRFVVVWKNSWSHRTSYDALETFPQLVHLISTYYERVRETTSYRLYQRSRP